MLKIVREWFARTWRAYGHFLNFRELATWLGWWPHVLGGATYLITLALSNWWQGWHPYQVWLAALAAGFLIALTYCLFVVASRLKSTSQRTLGTSSAATERAALGPDMTIGQAINYLAHESQWGYDKPNDVAAYDVLDEALRAGHVVCWGQRCLTPMSEMEAATNRNPPAITLSGLEVSIPKTDWASMRLVPRWIIGHDYPSATCPHMPMPRGKEWTTCYAHLRVSSDEIKRTWPPRFPSNTNLRNTQLDHTIAIECAISNLRVATPKNERRYEISMFPASALGSTTDRDGVAMSYEWPDDGERIFRGALSIWKCIITNHGQATVFNVTLPFVAEFMEVVRDGNRWRSGKTVPAATPVELCIPTLAPHRPVSVYIYTVNPYFVTVQIPDEATLQTVGSNTAHKVRLLRTGAKTALLSPSKEPELDGEAVPT